MDRTLILDLSSDDEVTLDNTSTADNFDWITKLFEDVGGEIEDNPISNGGLFNLGDVIEAQNQEKEKEEEHDSDDVVVVGEVIVRKPKKSRNLVAKNSDDDDDDDDDDCVMLDGDPDKPKDEVKDPEDDSDDLCIVGETGQVACRDYPHPRHLCAKFPFSSTAHDNRCDMCHCYVCDSVAPCPLWNSGDHCHATDKDEYWKHERKRMRQIQNTACLMPVTKPIVSSLPQRLHLQHISTGPNQLLRPTSTSRVLPTFGLPNIIRNQRSGIAAASKRFQPHLVSRQILKSCNSQVQGNRDASLSPRVVSSRPSFKRSAPASRAVVSNRPTYPAPNNVGLPSLQLPDQQLNGNSTENNFVNSTASSLHLNINTTFSQPSTSSVSPGMLSLQLQGYSQPISHTSTSQYHGYGHSAAVASNIPYTYTSMNQTQNIPGLARPCNTNVQNSVTLSREQQSGVTQTISGPNISCSIPPDDLSSYTLRSNQTPLEQNYSSPILSCSTSSAMKSLSVNCQPSSAAENSLVQGGVPMHELLPSIEQNAQQLGNTEQLDFDFENWFQDGEPILGSQDSSFLLDMNNQASVPVPVDTGMLYFDFETSWKGLTHS